uniref:Uncharacterized protein n=1 Tax=Rhinopithecus bieti TaxID=61621 RepID=A0A2K6LY73_RHIBE
MWSLLLQGCCYKPRGRPRSPASCPRAVEGCFTMCSRSVCPPRPLWQSYS